MHSRRRRIEAPSSTGRESRTLLSSWVQKGQRILGGPTTSRAIRFYFSTCCVSMLNFKRFLARIEGGVDAPCWEGRPTGTLRARVSLQREIPAPGAGIGPPEPERAPRRGPLRPA